MNLPNADTWPYPRLTVVDGQIEMFYEKVQFAETRDGKVVRTWFEWRKFCERDWR